MKENKNNKWPLAMLFAATIIIADQISKWFVVEHILKPDTATGFLNWLQNPPAPEFFGYIIINPFFNVASVWNYGISFGMLSSGSNTPFMLIIMTAVITLILTIYMIRTTNHRIVMGLGMIIGGSIGNIIDRIRFSAVIDFLDFHIGEIHYPAFNVADSCIVLGIAFIVFDSLFSKSQKEGKQADDIK